MKVKSEKNIKNLKIIENKTDRYSWIKLKYKHEHIYTKSTKQIHFLIIVSHWISVIETEILANTNKLEQKADSIINELKTWEKTDWLFKLAIEINRKRRISLHGSLSRIEVSYLRNISIAKKKNWMY